MLEGYYEPLFQTRMVWAENADDWLLKVWGMEALSGLDIIVVDAPATQLGCLTGQSAHEEASQ